MQASQIIAMWSGPRNLSTAMMRSFGNRADCAAMDEPFYAAYLAATKINHPMAKAVIAAGQIDPQKVALSCLGPFEAPISYQKHMPHHMLEGFPIAWAAEAKNVFLIRHPVRVLASYAQKHEAVTAEDIGYRQMAKLYETIKTSTGQTPLVISSDDITQAPEAMLKLLCESLEISFDPAMLAWAPGPRPEDGIWGAHWYDAIWQSTGLQQKPLGPLPELPPHLEEISQSVMPYYEQMAHIKLRSSVSAG